MVSSQHRGNNWANRLSIVAVVVVRVVVVGVEVHVLGVVRVVRVERTRPIVAVRTCVVQLIVVAIASRRKPQLFFGNRLILTPKKIRWKFYSVNKLFYRTLAVTDCL